MKFRKFVSTLAVTILSVSALTACGKPEANAPAEIGAPNVQEQHVAQEQVKIGFMNTNLSNEYQVAMLDAARAKAAELGIKLIEQDGQGDATRQVSQMETLISQKVDAIVMAPYDKDACAPAVDKAAAAGIPLIILNSTVSNMDKATGFVGSDDKIAGVMAMEEMARVMDYKGNIMMIRGPIGNSAEVNRTEGIESVVAKYPDMKIIADQTAEWDREKAMKLMENKLQAKEQLNCVVAQNDEMAIGASKAIEAAGMQDSIKVIGIDAIPDALKAVEEGKLIATVFQDAKGQGELSLEVALKAAKGETIEKDNLVEFKLVTKENVAEFK